MGNDNSKKSANQLTEEEINSLMENTSFSREEIIQWHAGFIKDCKTSEFRSIMKTNDNKYIIFTERPKRSTGQKEIHGCI